MNKQHTFPLLTITLTLLLSLLLLSGCGSEEPEPTAVPTEAPTEVPTEAPTEVPTEVPTEAPEEPTAAPETNEDDGEEDSGEETGSGGDTSGGDTSGGDTSGGDNASSELPDIYTFAVSQPQIAQFAGLVERLDLVEKLQSEGPFTTFIPTNSAIESLPQSVQDDDELLYDIMLYHIVAEEIPNQALVDWGTATSLLGDELNILATDYGAVVENANLLGVTDQVNNGILYIIDQVMFPPALIEYAVEQNDVAGELTVMSQGNLHVEMGARSPIEYNTTPPTSGPHFPNIVAWEIYDEPIRYEQVVHNLEDAGVLIYYQCEEACPELVTTLTDFAQPLMDEGRHLVVLPNDPTWVIGDEPPLHKDMGAPIAVVAWNKILTLDEFDEERILAFVEAYEGIDNHARY